MNYKKLVHSVLLAGGVALGSSAFAATPSAEMLGNTCFGCHGTNGSSIGPATPTIAGISTEYFIEAMEAYASDERASTIMGRIARGYTEKEVELMAEFFAGLKAVPTKQDFDAKLAKRGAQLHDRNCEKCHAEGGSSSEDDAGILAGQPMHYIAYSLEDFTSGKRDMPKKMKKKLEQVQAREGEEGVKALLNYYASQQ